MFMVETLFSTI